MSDEDKRRTSDDLTSELPRVIPIFPLAGALLLPQGRLPLNIFEPRYVKMVKDARAGNGMIGMIQPSETVDTGTEPRLFRIGCLGKITAWEDTDDGHILITLTGVCRFRVLEELAHTTPYRKIVADYTEFAGDGDIITGDASSIDREQFLDRIKAYLETRGLSSDWRTVDEIPDIALVNSLAMMCPFEAAEKQALLETENVSLRAKTMIAIMDFALAQSVPTLHPH